MNKAKKRRSSEKTMHNEQNHPADPQSAEAVETLDEVLNAAESAAEEPGSDAAQAEAAEAAECTEKAQAAEALAAALQKQEEYLGMAQRVQADFENFRRRNQNVRKEAFDDGARAFAATLLGVIDNLERAIAASEGTGDTSLREGVQMVYRQLCDAFTKRGITVIDRKGQPFDPNLENAVMQGAPEDGEPGTVCEVLQKGYQMEGMVLRHAMVKVVPE